MAGSENESVEVSRWDSFKASISERWNASKTWMSEQRDSSKTWMSEQWNSLKAGITKPRDQAKNLPCLQSLLVFSGKMETAGIVSLIFGFLPCVAGDFFYHTSRGLYQAVNTRCGTKPQDKPANTELLRKAPASSQQQKEEAPALDENAVIANATSTYDITRKAIRKADETHSIASSLIKNAVAQVSKLEAAKEERERWFYKIGDVFLSEADSYKNQATKLNLQALALKKAADELKDQATTIELKINLHTKNTLLSDNILLLRGDRDTPEINVTLLVNQTASLTESLTTDTATLKREIKPLNTKIAEVDRLINQADTTLLPYEKKDAGNILNICSRAREKPFQEGLEPEVVRIITREPSRLRRASGASRTSISS